MMNPFRANVFLFLALSLLWVRPDPVEAGTSLTYENWAQGFFTLNCVPCHNSSLSGPERFGAPRNVNLDTLDLIRAQLDSIRDAATGDEPFMPPMGVVWWWDRVSLREWLDAGAPGQADSLHPIEQEPREITLSYRSGGLLLSEPVDENENGVVDGEEFDHRFIGIYPEEDERETFEGMITIRYFDIRKRTDGTVIMTATRWLERNADWSEVRIRQIDYTPWVPIYLGDENRAGERWEADVTARERRWNGWMDGVPVRDNTRSEHWIVTHAGLGRIDNAVIPPQEALKVVQANLTTDTTTTWWYKKGIGVIRRETDAPSGEYVREVTREMNVITSEYPLYGPHLIEAASQDWFPFVGRWGETGYWHELETEVVGILEGQTGPGPTPTRTLPPDPTQVPTVPTPTATPFPSGLPPEKPTATATSTFPPTPPSEPPVQPTPTSEDPNDPRRYDHNKDRTVDTRDLLMFLKHWHASIEEEGGGN